MCSHSSIKSISEKTWTNHSSDTVLQFFQGFLNQTLAYLEQLPCIAALALLFKHNCPCRLLQNSSSHEPLQSKWLFFYGQVFPMLCLPKYLLDMKSIFLFCHTILSGQKLHNLCQTFKHIRQWHIIMKQCEETHVFVHGQSKHQDMNVTLE